MRWCGRQGGHGVVAVGKRFTELPNGEKSVTNIFIHVSARSMDASMDDGGDPIGKDHGLGFKYCGEEQNQFVHE